ncbi:unnamed protein product [Ilex paraguariensis]|uniref:Uncharacterized protein n=1 Tax=Ilex paraguariensis TaxID=185542 RepID=A0ABC8SN59_9AQUA
MAINSTPKSASLSSLFPSLLFTSPSHPQVSHLKFDRCSLLTVGNRQKPINLVKPATSNLLRIRAETSPSVNKSEPMVPPYNVLITGSTKGWVFFSVFPFLHPLCSCP